LNRHYCFYIKFIIWVYDDCFNNVVMSKVGAITAIVGDLLQQWLILMFKIRVSLYFIKSKSYEYSLIIYWTAHVFNCFDAMGRNVNKQSRFCVPHIFNKFIFSVIFLHAWITIFCSFSFSRELVTLLQYG